MIVPKLIKSTTTQSRKTHKCRERQPMNVLDNVPDKPQTIDFNKRVSELESQVCALEGQVCELQSNVKQLELEVEDLQKKNEQQNNENDILRQKLRQKQFSVERFQDNDSDFEFYTGLPNYCTFKSFYDSLSPACENLNYSGCADKATTEPDMRGRKKALSYENELFLCLVRLRCGLLERDLAHRFSISVSQVSRIWITWLDFLQSSLRSIPIWPSQSYVQLTMPASFKEHYPKTRVIIDCTELIPRNAITTYNPKRNILILQAPQHSTTKV